MGRLMKADWMKLRSSRTFIVCTVLALILGALLTIVYYIVWLNIGETLEMSREYLMSFGLPEKMVDETLSVVPHDNMWSYVNTCLADTNVMYLVAIVVCVYVATEYNMGTYKLPVARGYSRGKVFFSKWLMSLPAMLFVTVAYVLGGMIASSVMFGFSADVSAGEILTELGAYLSLYIAATSLFVMLSVVTKKTSTAVALAIIVPILLESGLTILMIAYKDLEVSQYWLFNTITSTQTLYQNGQAYIPFLVAAAYCAVSLVIGALVFRRQEMK